MYHGNPKARVLDQPGWIELAVSTYPLRGDPSGPVPGAEGLAQDPAFVYDPQRAWDPTSEEGAGGAYPWHFRSYRWLRESAADSASTATALVSGVKTYNGAINVDGNGSPILDTLAHLAGMSGRRVGVLTTVPLSHATSAALAGVQATSRAHTCALALQMYTRPWIHFLAGCGHPEFDDSGHPVEAASPKRFAYLGGPEVWNHLTRNEPLVAGQEVCVLDGQLPIELKPDDVTALARWESRHELSEIESLANGPTPDRLLIAPRVGKTLQQGRASAADPRETEPGADTPSPGVPDLGLLTRVALNTLDESPEGFFLGIEGGAVDWAMHDTQFGRMIEEMGEFEDAVAAVAEWVESHGGWDETLLVVTSDHDHLVWGPESHIEAFQPIADRGAGEVPGYRWLNDSHSNSLVPLFARGPGAEGLLRIATRHDPVRGPYIDQTDAYRAMRTALGVD